MPPACFLLPLVLFAPPDARIFSFNYSVEIVELVPGRTARIWVPIPPTNDEQTIEVLERSAPGRSRLTRDPEYGNGIWSIEAPADATGTIKLIVRYRVVRRTVTPEIAVGGDTSRMLRPDRLVPLEGKPVKLLSGQFFPEGERARARTLFDLVFNHMRYSKDVVGWGRGDANWACDSRSGNCTDFHSLFMSLARSRGLPTRFEIGFGLPLEKGFGEITGYHCWAKVFADGQWLPVDISEPSKLAVNCDDYFGRLPPNRVLFSSGRDVTLVPKTASGPINFFIYPHVEVDGKPYPIEKIKGKYTFADQ